MGAVVGPSLAIFFLSIFNNNYSKIFWLSMAPGITAVLLIILFIREKKMNPASHTKRRHLKYASGAKLMKTF